MKINKSNLPYFYEDTSEWLTLPSGIEQQVAWEYIVEEGSAITVDEEKHPMLVERLKRVQRYKFDEYAVSACSVDEWRYLEKEDEPYASAMHGHRGFWEGTITKSQQFILQPEVAIILCFTPDVHEVAPYIKTVTQSNLLELLEKACQLFDDETRLSAHDPRPIGAPPDAPEDVVEILHQMRGKANLLTTRGRASLLKMMMETTGTELGNGGWHISEKEITRRKKLMQ